MSAPNDFTGQRFGRFTVLERVENDKRGNTMWKCRCDCGNIVTVVGYSLKSGRSKSCGCAQIESVVEMNKRCKSTHGKKNTRLYRIWNGMKSRCFNKNDQDYCNYGGRGITVCEKWRHDFMAFYDWAVANGYDDSLSIDRVNNNGNYEPDNCRWATTSQQNSNRRKYRWRKNR